VFVFCGAGIAVSFLNGINLLTVNVYENAKDEE
jgi:hypothetical protein